MLTVNDIENRAASAPMLPIVEGDRAAFAVALKLQGYSAERAQQIAYELADNDGVLQMLARHRTGWLRMWAN